jgi:hypothetical protein
MTCCGQRRMELKQSRPAARGGGERSPSPFKASKLASTAGQPSRAVSSAAKRAFLARNGRLRYGAGGRVRREGA